MGKLWRRIQFLLRRDRFAREMEEELEFHLELKTQDGVAAGMTGQQARLEARRKLGSTARIQEEAREVWVIRAFETVAQDLRYAARVLRKSPGFAAVSIAGLGLGIGISAAMFTQVRDLWKRQLHPMPDPERYVGLWTSAVANQPFSYADFVHLRDSAKTMAGLAAWGRAAVVWTGWGDPELILAQYESASAIPLFGETPPLGRAFLPDEENAVILNYRIWESRFGADPEVIGKTITLDGAPYTVAGVAPRAYSLYHRAQFFLPLSERSKARSLRLGGRLREGASIEQARAELTALLDAVRKPSPANRPRASVLLTEGGAEPNATRNLVQMAALILTVTGMILLIAIANTANLLLARAQARRREIAARLSLGASRGRLVRQLLTESLLLASAAGALGVLLAYWLTRLLNAFVSSPGGPEAKLDGWVVAYTALITTVSAAGFGLAPALEASSPNLAGALKQKPRRLRNALVIGPLAVSLILLAGAGMTLRYLRQLYERNAGILVDKTIVMNFRLDAQGYDESRAALFHDQLRERLERIPGVRSVAIARDISPLAIDFHRLQLPVRFDGSDLLPDGRPARAMRNIVSPNYFAAMGNRIVRGRGFTDQDSRSAPPVAVINRAMARAFWPGADPLGKQFRIGDLPGFVQVVGVVSDVWDGSQELTQPPLAYFPIAQGGGFKETTRYQFLVLTGAGSEDMEKRILPAMRAEARQLDPKLVIDSGSARSKADDLLSGVGIVAALIGSLGLLATFLAAVGIYGVMAYAVSQRTQEIGIRLALGARKPDVLRLVMQRSLALTAIGIGMGLVGAIGLGTLLRTQLFGGAAGASDLPPFVLAAGILGAVALLASYLPARRATKVDPLVALRYE